MAEPFLGQVIMAGFNFAPRGYAICDGQILSIAQNTALFALLGTTFGGDGVQIIMDASAALKMSFHSAAVNWSPGFR